MAVAPLGVVEALKVRLSIKLHARNELTSISSIFVLIVVLQVASAALSIEVLSAVRAYASGESLYSKGQKDGLLHLNDYISSRREQDYQAFRRALETNDGNALARRSLQKPRPDFEAARRGFLEGKNHPEDIDGLVYLFAWAQDTPYMKRAIELWTEADQKIALLKTQVEDARVDIRHGQVDSPSIRRLVANAPLINSELTRLEGEFGDELGSASRLITSMLIGVNLVLAGFLLTLGGIQVRRLLRIHRRREVEMTALVSGVADCLMTIDGSRHIVLFNRAAEAMFGCSAAQAKGKHVRQFLTSDDESESTWTTSESDLGAIHFLEGRRRDGKTLQLEATVSPLHTEGGDHTTIICRDVTERQRALEQERRGLEKRADELQQKVYTDSLTGLANRDALERHLNEVLSIRQSDGEQLSLLFLDLDGFKAVNDSFGHLVGDELLRRVAARLRKVIRQHDRVFRISGDEFVVVAAHDVDEKIAHELANRLVATVREPYLVGHETIHVTVSIGVAIYPENGTDARALLLAADSSMYRAKQDGKDRFKSLC